mmetsp:Transcript_18551/g.47161  ORF Transcript_18551/g.47161 Transcript_18551/m.47161 type:complete len:199 (+) Transcript_18551:293-889(+)|eukprot:CAMPEP_0177649328 /NCGR_PEP_ID=MMETSP0447-20121125/11323_1 /TAXON_ID=0 /ORGANISM="Stygamoeba regulata, Strain BSH-02190019" /LENGTH=198 /DNA_ID=CAMNT_0019152069 /DNA_START=109 /DNA_END=705 /DNA_ORIENTATION=+
MRLSSVVCVLLVAVLASAASSVHARGDATLPELNKIMKHTFSLAYSCGGSYQASSLALDGDYSKNAPDLLFNGACGSKTSFESNFSGDDMAVLSLIGNSKDVPLANVTAHLAFNWANTVGQDNIFKQAVYAAPDTTYAALRSQGTGPSSTRTLFAFQTLSGCEDASEPCEILYAVLDYAKVNYESVSPGFDWTKQNSF